MNIDIINQNFRFKGKAPPGKIYIGKIQDATSRVNQGSIPSKFETVVYANNRRPGFKTSQARFLENNNDNPGPGQYEEQQSFSMTQSIIPKQVTNTGFASSAMRIPFQQRYLNSGPGPGQYSSKSSVLKEYKNIKGSQAFLTVSNTDNKQKLLKLKGKQPGPAEYDQNLNQIHYYQNKNVKNQRDPKHSSKSAFVSQTIRGFKEIDRKFNLGPGQYQIAKPILQQKPYQQSQYLSSFMPEINKKETKNNMNEAGKFLDQDEMVVQQKRIVKRKPQNPPPWQYEYHEPKFYSSYLQNQPSRNFKLQKMTRFGELEPQDHKAIRHPKPEPGTYDYRSQFEVNKEDNFGTVFKSTSKRVPFNNYDKKLGPSFVNQTSHLNKKSFMLNLNKKWV